MWRRTSGNHPRPQDLHLVVEVAESSLGFDLTTKAALYARANIVASWVLDVIGRRMIVHRDPQEGRYASVVAYSSEESVAPLAAPNSPLRIGDVLAA
jgi:Uma2 family endonuclease